jgi:protein-S-isoprenylcysteine O-methyltransferase Ste14
MYLGVATLIFSQAILFKSALVAVYGAIVWLCFHLIVMLIEEPHLRRQHDPSDDEVCRTIRR